MASHGLLLVFHLPEGSSKARHRDFRRAVYGEKTSSWGGKYTYRRHGVLDELPHVQLYTGVVILRSEDEGSLVRVVREEGALVQRREVRLTRSDLRALRLVTR